MDATTQAEIAAIHVAIRQLAADLKAIASLLHELKLKQDSTDKYVYTQITPVLNELGIHDYYSSYSL